jgi:ABC-type antimicrobial peptide transport system permease subunit
MFLLGFCVFFGVAILIGIAAATFPPLMIPATILLAVLMLFVYPFTSCVLTLFYYDLRVRKEALDLELLGQQIGMSQTAS